MAALGYRLCLLLWDRCWFRFSNLCSFRDGRWGKFCLLTPLGSLHFQMCSPLLLLKSSSYTWGCWSQLPQEPVNAVSICQLEGVRGALFPIGLPSHCFCSRTMSQNQKIPCFLLDSVLCSHQQHTGQSPIVAFSPYCCRSFWVAKGLKTYLNLWRSNCPLCTHSFQWPKSHSLPAVERLRDFFFCSPSFQTLWVWSCMWKDSRI